MTLIKSGPNRQSIPLADRLTELSPRKRFLMAVLNGIKTDPARTGAVVAHCPLPSTSTTFNKRNSVFSLNQVAFGNNYTLYSKYTLVQKFGFRGAPSGFLFSRVGAA